MIIELEVEFIFILSIFLYTESKANSRVFIRYTVVRILQILIKLFLTLKFLESEITKPI